LTTASCGAVVLWIIYDVVSLQSQRSTVNLHPYGGMCAVPTVTVEVVLQSPGILAVEPAFHLHFTTLLHVCGVEMVCCAVFMCCNQVQLPEHVQEHVWPSCSWPWPWPCMLFGSTAHLSALVIDTTDRAPAGLQSSIVLRILLGAHGGCCATPVALVEGGS
jgi:hypothetical protein